MERTFEQLRWQSRLFAKYLEMGYSTDQALASSRHLLNTHYDQGYTAEQALCSFGGYIDKLRREEELCQ